MRVVYATSITQKLREAVIDASLQNKSIDHFVLTKEELEELDREFTPLVRGGLFTGFRAQRRFLGVRIECEPT